MSDHIKHECGLAFLRLRRPISYYVEQYNNPLYGLQKVQLLMQKQLNRGQDGAGLANLKLNAPIGERYISRKRALGPTGFQQVFDQINARFVELKKALPEKYFDVEYLQKEHSFTGEIFLGHLRYATYGKYSIESCHPFLRQNNWKNRNLIVAGNFNLTNVDELFNELVELGQEPKEKVDTVTVMEKIGHFLDAQNQSLFNAFKAQGYSNKEITRLISKNLDLVQILKRSSQKWDGGYVMSGIVGNGDSFVLRDPNGIRPCYYHINDEVIVAASERPAIQTTLHLHTEDVQELKPGNALIIKRDGSVTEEQILEPKRKTACSFERIYFSRGNDAEIQKERKQLGAELATKVLKELNQNVNDVVFTYIPNSAELAFQGLVEALREITDSRIRAEKVIIKEAKQRTFITDDNNRDDLVAQSYDITYGIVKNTDTLVVVDDSIVRGTTMRKSILKMLERLAPKRIILVSSSPQVRYPDCYGIYMTKMSEFVAFNALIKLLKHDSERANLLEQAYQDSLQNDAINPIANLYNQYSCEAISSTIAEIISPENFPIPVDTIYQSLNSLRVSCPDNLGHWYFDGKYPTIGGYKVLNKSFQNWYSGNGNRASY